MNILLWFLAILLLPFYSLLKWSIKRMKLKEKVFIKDNMVIVLKSSNK